MTVLGIDRLLSDPMRLNRLKGRRLALVAHPASVTRSLQHSLDALFAAGVKVQLAFGPQHGLRGDKQDNMIESEDSFDVEHGIPVVSLYSETRRPSPALLSQYDLVLFDLQDLGCRVYTYLRTMTYFLHALHGLATEFWLLDRPNPAGRLMDGLRLEPGQESFVGCDVLPMRHGMTLGELALWYRNRHGLDVDLSVIPMASYDPDGAGQGWPAEFAWVNPSPNASSVNMARCFSGTVLLEGTHLSEGRGTSTPLEVIGAPELPVADLLKTMTELGKGWMEGAVLRPCWFEPTFHKHAGRLCEGLQIHADGHGYFHEAFRPWCLVALLLKALRCLQPDYDLWRNHAYEYELERLPVDVINGGPGLRQWVDNPGADCAQLDVVLQQQLSDWQVERQPFLLYGPDSTP